MILKHTQPCSSPLIWFVKLQQFIGEWLDFIFEPFEVNLFFFFFFFFFFFKKKKTMAVQNMMMSICKTTCNDISLYRSLDNLQRYFRQVSLQTKQWSMFSSLNLYWYSRENAQLFTYALGFGNADGWMAKLQDFSSEFLGQIYNWINGKGPMFWWSLPQNSLLMIWKFTYSLNH